MAPTQVQKPLAASRLSIVRGHSNELFGSDDMHHTSLIPSERHTPYSHHQTPTRVQVADMVTRLSTGDWFTAKVSACGLFTAAYKHISDPDQRTLLRAQVQCITPTKVLDDTRYTKVSRYVCQGLIALQTFKPHRSAHGGQLSLLNSGASE